MDKLPESKTVQFFRVLQFIGLLMGGLATLPIASASLPMPPEWRPYLLGFALLCAGLKILVQIILDAWKSFNNSNP